MRKERIAITGAKGQLGMDLMEFFNEKGIEVFGLSRQELDITDIDKVKKILGKINPTIIIHAAAYTKVDLAQSEPDHSFLINAIGTRNVAITAENLGAKLVYISTDYVFDGSANRSYNEFSQTSPLSIYGKSKLAGEQFVRDFHSSYFIVRTSWLYGKHGNNFVETMLKLAHEQQELTVVSDQFGCPTYTIDLAKCIFDLIRTEKYGIYHISNSGSCSWYEFAKAIFEETKIKVTLKECTTKEFPRPAPRPANSTFDHMSLRINGFSEMRNWREALEEFLKSK